MNSEKQIQLGIVFLLAAIVFAPDTNCWGHDDSDWQYLEKDPEKKICFALYTVDKRTLRIVAQLYPLAPHESRDIKLQIFKRGRWIEVAASNVRENEYGIHGAKAWNALLTVQNWEHNKDWRYRIVALNGAARYDGIIRKNPSDKREIVIAAFTGNSNGDRRQKPDIIKNVKHIDPDLLFFSGDQSYDHEHHLHAWLLFGRQFGEITRNRPTVVIPDDHDIGQGNLWGASGRKSTGAGGHADGGFSYPVEYVNEVQFAQTANLPVPFDPTPVQRGIGVYYTSLNVGGVDFAIIEDRKFKSGPMGLVDAPGHARPDLINAPNYDPASVDHPKAKLLGARQLTFLKNWSADWQDVQMKCVLSQTIFANAAHKTGNWRIVADLDSNGWPQTGRNRALREIRKGFAFMIAGDQHLGTVIHHGIDDWRDSGFSFCVPSIVNFWPRSWLPAEKGLNPVSAKLEHTGDFHDGFGNKLTMHAYSNPNKEWKEIGTRDNPFAGGAAGFGVVRFDKNERTITAECWPRNIDVSDDDQKQFPGWPITIHQYENYGRPAKAYLPELQFIGQTDPVLQIIEEHDDEIIYTIRIQGNLFRPKVFATGLYTIKIGEGESQKVLRGVQASAEKTNSSNGIQIRLTQSND